MSLLTFSVMLVILLASLCTFRYGAFDNASSGRFTSANVRVGASFGIPRWEDKSGMSADSSPDLIDRVFRLLETTVSWFVWNFQTFRPRTAIVAILDLLARTLSVFVSFVKEVKAYVASLFSCSPPQSQYFIYVQKQSKYCEAYNNYYQVPVQTSLFDKCLVLLTMLTSLSSVILIKFVRAKRSKNAAIKQCEKENTSTNPSANIFPEHGDSVVKKKKSVKHPDSAFLIRDRTPFCSDDCSRSFTLFGRCKEHDPKRNAFDPIAYGRFADNKLLENELDLEPCVVEPLYVPPFVTLPKVHQPKPKWGGKNTWKLQRASRLAAKHRARTKHQIVWKHR